MRKLLQQFMMLACIVIGSVQLVNAQGSTTSNISGRVTDESGEPLPGATIIAVHGPSGSRYGNTSDAQGYYRIANVKSGGPYSITVNFVGFAEYKKENVYLQLGQTYGFDVPMSETAIDLEGVTVVGRRDEIIDGNRTGAESVVTQDVMNATPTVARAIGDFAKFSPQANITEGSDGFSISLNGMNNRYNAIYINGTVSNDVFGLAGSGTNGGQTGVSPISIDAVEEWSVQIAPFDVRLAGFAGGAINALTRSGSNEVTGSAYWFFRNQSMAGKTPTFPDPDVERTQLADFTAQTFGLRVGGPIIKDKLFYFVSVEAQRDETPQPFDFATYEGDATRDDLNALESKVRSGEFNAYDPGTFETNTTVLDSDKLFVRFDYNINDNNKIYFSHNYVKGENVEAVQSNTRNIRYENSSEFFPTTTNSSVLEWNFSKGNIANKLTFGYTRVRDDRDPLGANYPFLDIDDGAGRIRLGSEQFSTANQLDQDIITLTNNFEVFKGPHNALFGVNFEHYDVYNLFIRQNFGVYEYNSLSDFLNDELPREFYRSYSLVDRTTGDGSEAAAIFKAMQVGLYVQDEWQVLDNLKLTGGLRGDIFIYPDNTPENTDFNQNTIPLIEAEGYSLRGAQTGKFVDPQFYFSPRLGFNWDITKKQETQLRGGIGIFVSRAPLVWPGGAYNNNGLTVGGDFTTDPANEGWRRIQSEQIWNGQFVPQWDDQPQSTFPGEGEPSGQIDLFASDFRLPIFTKFNLAIDQKLPWDLIGTVEGIFTKTNNNVFYENLNLRPSNQNLVGPDRRPYYDRSDEIDPTYTRILLGSNTDLGYAWNITVSLTKPFTNGLFTTLSYTYGDSQTIYDGTSSQNSSQWRGQHSIIGRNYFQTGGPRSEDLQRSDFAMGHRVYWSVSYRKEYADHFASQLSIFWNIQNGQPYSYIYDDNGGLNNEDSRERNLIYVPANQSEINLVDWEDGDGNIIATADEQWAELDAFINNDSYLKDRRGQYAERNSNRTPWTSIMDLRFLQDFFITSGSGRRHTLQLSVDIYNFGNLINKDWGRRFNPSFGGWQLLRLENSGDLPAEQPEFTFRSDRDLEPYFIDDSGLTSSRWQMQIGLRYLF